MSGKILDFPSKITNSGRIHICRVCGKESTWLPGWMWKDLFHKGSGNGDPGWEEPYITCSDKCREQIQKRT